MGVGRPPLRGAQAGPWVKDPRKMGSVFTNPCWLMMGMIYDHIYYRHIYIYPYILYIIYYHILSYIIKYYHILSYIIIYYHILSYIIIYYHILSYIIIYTSNYTRLYYHIGDYNSPVGESWGIPTKTPAIFGKSWGWPPPLGLSAKEVRPKARHTMIPTKRQHRTTATQLWL